MFKLLILHSGMTKATSAANYIFWLQELQPTIRKTSENYNIGPDNFSSLALENLQFSYPMRPHARILRGIDLHVRILSSLLPSLSLALRHVANANDVD